MNNSTCFYLTGTYCFCFSSIPEEGDTEYLEIKRHRVLLRKKLYPLGAVLGCELPPFTGMRTLLLWSFVFS